MNDGGLVALMMIVLQKHEARGKEQEVKRVRS